MFDRHLGMENNSVLERIGTAEEVASIISFVCSPEASWLCCRLLHLIFWILQDLSEFSFILIHSEVHS